MRKNYPVTQREYPFPRNGTLVSTTDLKGRITYCNPSFIEVSGYAQDELLGQAHSLIRHPDMPEEAFRDMWATIQSGQPWSGAVKNRRKNGDYYWVMANVTPLVEGSRLVGYMSVRTEASKETVKGAEELYARMQAEARAGRKVHVLSHGEVERRTLGGRLVSLHARLGMGVKITAAMALCGAHARRVAASLDGGRHGGARRRARGLHCATPADGAARPARRLREPHGGGRSDAEGHSDRQ